MVLEFGHDLARGFVGAPGELIGSCYRLTDFVRHYLLRVGRSLVLYPPNSRVLVKNFLIWRFLP